MRPEGWGPPTADFPPWQDWRIKLLLAVLVIVLLVGLLLTTPVPPWYYR